MNPIPRPDRAGGQIIVVFALALVAIIAMTGLVIDGGAAFAQQRVAQNGADGTANAGTVVIAEKLSGATRTGAQVRDAIDNVAAANGLGNVEAEYTDDYGNPIGVAVTAGGSIPEDARGVRVRGSRNVDTTFSRVIGVNQITASAEATVVAGALSGEYTEALLPVTFPVRVYQCDSGGDLLPGPWIGAPPPGHEGEFNWTVVGAADLPSAANPTGNTSTMAILPLCRSSGLSSGTFGWLDLASGMNLAQEITGPLNIIFNVPDWYQTQTGNPNSVEDELMAYWHQPVLIPLHNQACRVDPGDTAVCPDPGVGPVGNNTWYYVHTVGVFYIDQVLVQGSNVDECTSLPGSPLVPTTSGGFLGCLKGWFVNYLFSGPITPGGTIIPGQTAIGIQLIK